MPRWGELTPDWVDMVAVNRAWKGFSVGRELTTAEKVRLAEMVLLGEDGDGQAAKFSRMVKMSGSRAAEIMRTARANLIKRGRLAA